MSLENKMWKFLVESELFTENELKLVTDVAGYSHETLDQACFSRFGYDFDGVVYEYKRGEL